MEKKKKTWAEPKLTALVRRKPEEGILGACKQDGSGSRPEGCNSECLDVLATCYMWCSSSMGT